MADEQPNKRARVQERKTKFTASYDTHKTTTPEAWLSELEENAEWVTLVEMPSFRARAQFGKRLGEVLARCPELRYFDFRSPRTCVGVREVCAGLAKCRKLTCLDFELVVWTEKTLKALVDVLKSGAGATIKVLDLINCDFSAADPTALFKLVGTPSLAALEELHLTNARFRARPYVAEKEAGGKPKDHMMSLVALFDGVSRSRMRRLKMSACGYSTGRAHVPEVFAAMIRMIRTTTTLETLEMEERVSFNADDIEGARIRCLNELSAALEHNSSLKTIWYDWEQVLRRDYVNGRFVLRDDAGKAAAVRFGRTIAVSRTLESIGFSRWSNDAEMGPVEDHPEVNKWFDRVTNAAYGTKMMRSLAPPEVRDIDDAWKKVFSFLQPSASA